MKGKNNTGAAVEDMAAGRYEITPATARLFDCLRAGNAYYAMINDAIQMRYKDTMTEAEAEDYTIARYLGAINSINEQLRKEIDGSITDAIGDTKNTAAAVIRL